MIKSINFKQFIQEKRISDLEYLENKKKSDNYFNFDISKAICHCEIEGCNIELNKSIHGLCLTHEREWITYLRKLETQTKLNYTLHIKRYNEFKKNKENDENEKRK